MDNSQSRIISLQLRLVAHSRQLCIISVQFLFHGGHGGGGYDRMIAIILRKETQKVKNSLVSHGKETKAR